MIGTLFDFIKDPKDAANIQCMVELVLSLALLVVGVVAIAYSPATLPLGVVGAILGLAGVVFGHW